MTGTDPDNGCTFYPIRYGYAATIYKMQGDNEIHPMKEGLTDEFLDGILSMPGVRQEVEKLGTDGKRWASSLPAVRILSALHYIACCLLLLLSSVAIIFSYFFWLTYWFFFVVV